ncbi:MAG TPA: hypothetical protein P5323_00830 [Candidatus Moranbacteria bacterium]|nr:hypothetical protein [Candidatus Moranbacteria bacterium]HSA08018.1 hypothetical protein [Candidatus Moranbacteria bacterium]
MFNRKIKNYRKTKLETYLTGVLLSTIVLGVFLVCQNAQAACTGSSPTWTTTPDYESVNSCITSATSGDTINVSAGTEIWDETILWTNKNIELVGAGRDVGGTHIDTSIAAIRSLVSSKTENKSQVTGFKFHYISASADDSDVDFITMQGQGWRVYNNDIENDSDTDHVHSMVAVVGNATNSGGIQPYGLVDSNIIHEARVRVFGGAEGQYWATSLAAWADDSPIGTANAMYVENNTFTRDTENGEWNDASLGGKYVFRFNTLTGKHQMHSHSIQSPQMRATRSWEIYNNKYFSPMAQFMFIRGGTGMIFNNEIDGSSTYFISFDNVRSNTCNDGACGTANPQSVLCDGNSAWDGNVEGQQGWPCRDQIGRGKDSGLFDLVNYDASTSEPVYLWNNKKTTGAVAAVSVYTSGRNATHIVADRDFYDHNASFDGTSGVGSGLKADMPETCTPSAADPNGGPAYWATDENKLYRCTDTNEWTLHYTPYTCPHPLAGTGSCNLDVVGTEGYIVSGDTTAPAAPSGLSIG